MFGEMWTGHSIVLVQFDGTPLLYNPTSDTWHVGPTPHSPDQWLDSPAVAFNGRIVIASGASWLADPDCCTFSPGTYAYQPPAGY